MITGEYPKALQATIAGEEVSSPQHVQRRKGKRMVKQSRTDLQLAAGVNLFYKWFVDAVPVFKSRFQVALDEVNGGEKIASIGIVRIDLQAVTEPGCCFPIAILFVRDTAQLDGKSLIARL